MVKIASPGSLWVQLLNACFFGSGFFGDLLVLRFLLMVAYLFLLINVAVGAPAWPRFWATKENYVLFADSLVWGVCNLYLHGSGFLGIFRDERYVDLEESQEPLWRMMYRKSGLSRLVFQKLVSSKFKLFQFSKGAVLSDEGDDNTPDESVYLIVNGSIKLALGNGNCFLIPSGGVVGLRHLHLFRHRGGCAFDDLTSKATCLTAVSAYRCSRRDIEALATTSQTKLAWQALLIYGLTEFGLISAADHSHDDEEEARLLTSCEIAKNNLFDPLEDWEQPNPMAPGSGQAALRPLKHVIHCAIATFLPPWPFYRWVPALRHDKLSAPHFVLNSSQIFVKRNHNGPSSTIPKE